MDQGSKNILVTGGTGFIGVALVHALLDKGHKVTVYSRNARQAGKKFPKAVQVITSLQEQPDKPYTTIINLAGEPIAQYWTKRAKARIMHSRIETTRQLFAAIQQAKTKPTLFISGSAIGYYLGCDGMCSEETLPLQSATSFSTKLCQAWEREANKIADLGVRTCLLRIAVVLEKNGGTLAKLWPSFIMGLGSIIGSGQQKISWIHRKDLLRIILYLIENPELKAAINAAAPDPVTQKQFAQTLAKTLSRPLLLRLPHWVFHSIFGQMAKELMLESIEVQPKKILAAKYTFLHAELKDALKAIYS